MELFEQLRREYEFGIGTVKGVARQFGVHRRMVRQAVESALPPLRGYRRRAKPALEPVVAFIDAVLEAIGTQVRAPLERRHDRVDRRRNLWRDADLERGWCNGSGRNSTRSGH